MDEDKIFNRFIELLRFEGVDESFFGDFDSPNEVGDNLNRLRNQHIPIEGPTGLPELSREQIFSTLKKENPRLANEFGVFHKLAKKGKEKDYLNNRRNTLEALNSF